jgi:hypothetical protein
VKASRRHDRRFRDAVPVCPAIRLAVFIGKLA